MTSYGNYSRTFIDTITATVITRSH